MKKRPKKKTKKLSDEIRDAIETCGMTRYQICKQTGVDNATLCRFAKGRHGLSLDTIDRVAACIGLRVVMESESERKKGG